MMDQVSGRTYLDFNASTPIAPEVMEAMTPYMSGFVGNPSSQHWAGAPYKEASSKARRQVANLLGALEEEIFFTSGGSESNNWAIKGSFFASEKNRRHIITTQIEHPPVSGPCEYLKRFGAEVTYITVDSRGKVHPKVVADAIRKDTFLISIMHANNEVGTVQPLKEISAIARAQGILMHSDAAQSVGKIEVNVNELGVDLLTIAGHKLYVPKGIGALYVRKGTHLDPIIHGAGHEFGMRAGTEAIHLCVGLGKACELEASSSDRERVTAMRALLRNLLQERFGASIVINGDEIHYLPNTLSVSFVGKIGHQILSRLPSLAASTGSACHSGTERMSSTLTAMGIEPKVGLGTLRLSLGRTSTEQEIRDVVEAIAAVV